jgi:hypothetical protein
MDHARTGDSAPAVRFSDAQSRQMLVAGPSTSWAARKALAAVQVVCRQGEFLNHFDPSTGVSESRPAV